MEIDKELKNISKFDTLNLILTKSTHLSVSNETY